MVRGHVELPQGGVPDPEGRPPAGGGNHELPPERGPTVAAGDAMPSPRPRDRQGDSDRIVRWVRHSTSGLPVVPLVYSLNIQRGFRSSAMKAVGFSRTRSLSRMGQFATISQDA